MWVTSYKQRNENGDNRLLEKWFVLFNWDSKLNRNHWQQPFLISRKLARQNSNKKRQNLDSDSKNGRQNYTTAQKCRINGAQKQDCSTYSVVIKLVKRHHEPPVLLYFSGFPGWIACFSLQTFCLNNKIHFSLTNANNILSFKLV